MKKEADAKDERTNKEVFLEKQNKLKRLDLKVDESAQQRNIDRLIQEKLDSQEHFDVMYTKHLTQK